MKYIHIVRADYGQIITIGEYLQETQLYTYIKLKKYFLDNEVNKSPGLLDVTEFVASASDVYGLDKFYYDLMIERPKPGRGGLLPGEKGEVLWKNL